MALARTKRARKGLRESRAILARLDDAAFRERVRLTEDEMRLLDRLAAGKYQRGAGTMLAALRMRLEWAYAKPKQEVEHSGGLTVNVEINRTVKGEP